MVIGTLDKENRKLVVSYNGEQVTCNLVKIPLSKDKSENQDGYWANVEKLGAGRKWFTIKSLSEAEDIIEFDETAKREVTTKKSRVITKGNIEEFLNDEQIATLNELFEAACAERDRRVAEEEANKPVKEKKSRGKTNEEKIAELEAELAKRKAVLAGEISEDEIKPKHKVRRMEAPVNLDEE